MPNYLITGGAGFIGCNITRWFVENNEEVRILDNFSSGKRENIEDIIDKIELIEGDVCDYKIVEKAVKGIDYVFHYAAIPYVSFSIADPVTTVNVNTIGTINLLEASKKHNVKKFIFASSSAIYGNTETIPSPETLLPAPLSPYAITKLTGEYYCQFYYLTYGLKTICFRYFNVFGPYQNLESEYSAVIPIFINAILNDENPTIFGDGYQTRDFIYIDNVLDVNLLVINTNRADGKVLNVCRGKAVNLFDLINNINNVLEKNIKPAFAEKRTGDVRHSLGDNSNVKSVLGFSPKISFEEGIKKTIEWYKKEFRKKR